ncbi:MAG: hypothetical protein AB1611_11875 [bacterium]
MTDLAPVKVEEKRYDSLPAAQINLSGRQGRGKDDFQKLFHKLHP